MSKLITFVLVGSILFSITGVVLASPECEKAENTPTQTALPAVSAPDCCCDASAIYNHLNFETVSATSAIPLQTLIALVPFIPIAPADNFLRSRVSLMQIMGFDSSPPAFPAVLRI